MAADRVDLVDEHDARRVLLRLLEHVADTAGAHAHEHLDEVGARDGEEGHVGLAGDRARQQRLAGAGRADQQHALGDAAADGLELLRILEELHDLLEFLLRLVDAGHLVEGDPAVLLGQQASTGLAEAHGLAAARLHLAHEEHPDADQQQHREPRHQHAQQRRHVLVERLRADAHVVLGQAVDQVRVVGSVGVERAAILEVAADRIALDRDVADAAGFDLGQEVGERQDWSADRVPMGPWNRLNRAINKRPMITQRAKILAEIVHRVRLDVSLGTVSGRTGLHRAHRRIVPGTITLNKALRF